MVEIVGRRSTARVRLVNRRRFVSSVTIHVGIRVVEPLRTSGNRLVCANIEFRRRTAAFFDISDRLEEMRAMRCEREMRRSLPVLIFMLSRSSEFRVRVQSSGISCSSSSSLPAAPHCQQQACVATRLINARAGRSSFPLSRIRPRRLLYSSQRLDGDFL